MMQTTMQSFSFSCICMKQFANKKGKNPTCRFLP